MNNIAKLVIAFIVGFVCLLLALLALGLVIGLIAFIFKIVIGIAIVAGIIYFINYLFKLNNEPIFSSVEEFKVFNPEQKSVALFLNEPNIQDILKTSNSNQLSQLVQDGKIIELENDTQINVINDNEKESVKVKVLSGSQKNKIGWICRSTLVKRIDIKELS